MSVLSNPASRMVAITPSDTVDLNAQDRPRAIYVGGAGNIVFVFGTATATVPVLAGAIIPVRPTRINATSTTATSIFGMY